MLEETGHIPNERTLRTRTAFLFSEKQFGAGYMEFFRRQTVTSYYEAHAHVAHVNIVSIDGSHYLSTKYYERTLRA